MFKIGCNNSLVPRFIHVCFYCEKKGPIRPYCRDYIYDMRRMRRIQISQRTTNNYVRYVALTTMSVNFKKGWYFDTAFSRHMTEDPQVLQELLVGSSETVIFGDGDNGNVRGKGTLKVTRFPKLKNVMLVEGLKANLTSIN